MPYIEMPKLSDTMTEGKVVKWRKKTGDQFEVGEVLAEIETDKAVMDMEAFDDGTLAEILIPEGGTAKIGDKLAKFSNGNGGSMEEGAEAHTAHAREMKKEVAPAQKASDKPAEKAAEKPSDDKAAAKPSGEKEAKRVKASPLAKKIAASEGVDLKGIQGSGPGGRIIARDVQETSTASQTKSTPQVPRKSQGVLKKTPVTGIRKIIADRLLASKTQVPHFYLHVEVDVGELLQLRGMLNKAAEQNQLGKITVNDLILKAVAIAAQRVPQVNATFSPTEIVEYPNVDLAVAVAIDDGLITPIIRNAESLSLREMSETMKDLAERARQRKLKPDEFQGGTITLSNLGGYGIDAFDAIINPPHAMIVSVGAAVKKPVVNAEGQIVVGQRMDIGISADHRVVDGAIGAKFLGELRKIIETPAVILL
jgi:pyruvate dehydrogenase E2 component (dihydrolipoamide acetyltransferase)